jgi:membrane protease YdiL (CAAX protease family)
MDDAYSPSPAPRSAKLWSGILLEGLLAICAIGLSAIGFYDRRQNLGDFGWDQIRQGLIWGLVASLPLLGYLAVFHFSPPGWMHSLRKFCVEHLCPLFQGSAIWELALLSLAAGIGEELLFRWSLQGGLTSIFEVRLSQPVAEVIGLIIASLLFGLCHAVTKLYFTVTFIGGLFLGWTMFATSNWLVPAVAHALYDFAALVYIVRIMDRAETVQAEP